MAKHWKDYDGPTVGYMIDRGETRPLADPAALQDLAAAALLAGLGSSPLAAEYQAQFVVREPVPA
jgi:hypothetical protein